MENWKHSVFVATLIIFGIIVGFTACDGDTHDHDWQWVVIAHASYDADGLETETCSTCGATNGTRSISKLTVPADLIGTWKLTTSDATVIFTSNSYREESNPLIVTATVNSSELATNTDATTKDEYPSGYIFNLTVTAVNMDSAAYLIGQTKDSTYYLNSNKNKYCFLNVQNTWIYYEKQ